MNIYNLRFWFYVILVVLFIMQLSVFSTHMNVVRIENNTGSPIPHEQRIRPATYGVVEAVKMGLCVAATFISLKLIRSKKPLPTQQSPVSSLTHPQYNNNNKPPGTTTYHSYGGVSDGEGDEVYSKITRRNL